MTTNALYTDLSDYYDLMCADINYQEQSSLVHRLQQLFGSGGKKHLDLACGTGPHVQHFMELGYQCSGLDLNPAMLDLAKRRCPEAQFSLQNMSDFSVDEPVDLITCFLYSLHYCQSIEQLKACIANVHRALKVGGVFCFNAVDKEQIDNSKFVSHSLKHNNSLFVFSSAWHYVGDGEKQTLKISIERETLGVKQSWRDDHPMVALTFADLQSLLRPYFEIHVLEHDYSKITPWDSVSGNALFVCVKI